MGEMVTIPAAEYAALREAAEDLEDLLASIEIKAAIKRGDEEVIPGEIVERLLGGSESCLRIWREYRGLTQQALSDASGVNRVQIANIEGGTATGSVATLRKLAKALQLDIDDIVPREV